MPFSYILLKADVGSKLLESHEAEAEAEAKYKFAQPKPKPLSQRDKEKVKSGVAQGIQNTRMQALGQ